MRAYTEEQLSAINERNRTLLVSAAAGSGKTATLTERILRRLLDEKDPLDITRVLVVTFTRAAAGELRERISDALASALAEDPKNARLSRQLLLLPTARIRTIDSFCGEFVRQNADVLGISRHFRIAQTAEAALLSDAVMERLVEDGYAGRLENTSPLSISKADFRFLSETLADLWREKALPAKLSELHRKVSNYPLRAALFIRQGEAMLTPRKDPFETPWGEACQKRTLLFLEDAVARLDAFEEILNIRGSESELKYLPFLQKERAFFLALQSEAAKGYAALRQGLLSPSPFEKISDVPSEEKTESGNAYRSFRDSLKKNLAEEATLYRFTAEEYLAAAAEYGRLHHAVGKFLTLFEERFFEEKKLRAICEFNDISHMMLRLLYKEDGTLSPTAYHVRESFDEVYIDEYQDVNPVQHKIFEAIAGERCRFMVGDIKQAIYGFRGAKSDLFAEMRRTFPPLEQAGDSETASIFMSRNFRSDKPILDFTNEIFRFLFRHGAKSIGYQEKDSLQCGKKGGESATLLPVVAFAYLLPRKKGAPSAVSSSQRELDYVADEIARLLREGTLRNGEPIRPGDIAILLRTRTKMDLFVEALTRRGIPVVGDKTPDFFMTAEILLALCLLNAVNNPRRDIYLAGLLRSPIYDLSLDELILIREECPGETLFASLEKYVERHKDFSKGVRFLRELSRFRRLAEGLPADRLLRLLYRETGLLSIAGEGAPRNNLLLLLHYARNFEETSSRGLYRFIRYLNEVMRTRQTIDSASENATPAQNAVQLITAHGSKGLQFPVVFVSNLSTQFTAPPKKETQTDFHEALGLGVRLRDPSGFGVLDTPMCRTISRAMHDMETEEEMRLLYVALTRAEERLYITGAGKAGEETTAKAARLLRDTPTEYAVLNAGGAMPWILAGMKEGTYTPVSLATPSGESAPSEEEIAPEENTAAEELPHHSEEDILTVEKLFRQRFAFQYPHEAKTRLPRKLSVSRLSPKLLNEDRAGVVSLFEEPPKRHHAPAFITPRREEEPALAGTATHLFLQFCDPALLLKNGVESELCRLVAEEFISPEDASRVKPEEIRMFASSPLPRAMLESPRLYREFRFHMAFPAAALTSEEEQKEALRGETVLVQGVIDCLYFDKEGKCILLDYKTDRLPREALADPALAARILSERHGKQLAYYAAAAHRLFGRFPDEVQIYSLHSGNIIPVDVKNHLHSIGYREENDHDPA